jgi:hypothetical protein
MALSVISSSCKGKVSILSVHRFSGGGPLSVCWIKTLANIAPQFIRPKKQSIISTHGSVDMHDLRFLLKIYSKRDKGQWWGRFFNPWDVSAGRLFCRSGGKFTSWFESSRRMACDVLFQHDQQRTTAPCNRLEFAGGWRSRPAGTTGGKLTSMLKIAAPAGLSRSDGDFTNLSRKAYQPCRD